MGSVVFLVAITAGLWCYYLSLRGELKFRGHNSKGHFRRWLVLAWISTLLLAFYLCYLFLGPGRYGESGWL